MTCIETKLWRIPMTVIYQKPKGIIFIVSILLLLVFFGGCKDDPEYAAAKEARRSGAKALELIVEGGDLQAARKELEKAIRLAGKAGIAQDPAIILSANLQVEQSAELYGQMRDMQSQIAALIRQISSGLISIHNLQVDKAGLEALYAGSDKEIEVLEAMLSDDSEGLSLEAQLVRKDAEIDEIGAQIERLQIARDSAQATATELQQAADEYLRMAEQAEGKEKIKLQRQAYNILLGVSPSGEKLLSSKISWLAVAQEKQDEIDLLQDKFDLIQPGADKLAGAVGDIESQIEAIQNSEQRRDLLTQLRSIDGRTASLQKEIADLVAGMEEAVDVYSAKSDEAVRVLDEAKKTYRKARASDQELIAQLADIYSADCSFRTGSLLAVNGGFYRALAERVDALSGAAGDNRAVRNGLSEIVSISRDNADSDSDAAMEAYDQAAGEYDKLKRLTRGKDEFACAIVKNHILVLVQKASLAKWADDSAIFEEALTTTEDLVETARNCDADFDNSRVAILLARLTAEPEGATVGELPGSLDAMIAQIRPEIEMQFDAFMEMPQDQKDALIAEAVRDMRVQGLSAEQIAAVQEMMETGDKSGFVEFMSRMAAELMQQMAPAMEQVGEEMKAGMEQMGKEMEEAIKNETGSEDEDFE